jgi:hypothetical protein
MEFEPVRPGGRQVATRHPGRSLVALPFLLLGGTRAVFASGLAPHLATAMIAITTSSSKSAKPRRRREALLGRVMPVQ